MSKARIMLIGNDPEGIKKVILQIKEIAKALNMKIKGPVPLPTKHLRIVTRKTPCGDGTDTYETYEKRISKRFVDIEAPEKLIKQILKIKVPESVFVKIFLQ